MAKQTVYLLLGANLGNCPKTFALARRALSMHVGKIERASGLYTSPSWGFTAEEPFYNQALELTTELDPFALLRQVLDIEKQLGRTRTEDPLETQKQKYQSRSIDIDILFYNNAVITSRELIVPHPLLPERAFALVPLCEIAPDFTHPVLTRTVREMLESCPDNTAAVRPCADPTVQTLFSNIPPQSRTDFSPFQSSTDFSPYKVERTSVRSKTDEQSESPLPPEEIRFLCIEGNIGAGKTSLSRKISQQFGAKLVLEKFEDNAFLPKFYQDRERYAFPVELTFLAERYRQAKEDFVQELFSPFLVSDFTIAKSLIFAQNTLQADEYALFERLFRIILTSLPKPDRYVFLHSDIDRLMSNIRLRNRSYEQNMDPDYLRTIENGYISYLKTLDPSKVVIIETTHMDFVNNEADYQEILRRIGLA